MGRGIGELQHKDVLSSKKNLTAIDNFFSNIDTTKQI